MRRLLVLGIMATTAAGPEEMGAAGSSHGRSRAMSSTRPMLVKLFVLAAAVIAPCVTFSAMWPSMGGG
jgi:hypothetical protein